MRRYMVSVFQAGDVSTINSEECGGLLLSPSELISTKSESGSEVFRVFRIKFDRESLADLWLGKKVTIKGVSMIVVMNNVACPNEFGERRDVRVKE